MTNHWNDLANSDCILIMGSNPAENHPISFKWVLKAQDKGAKVVSVDPRFTHSSSKADFYVQLRVGTDIAFLGGMINYILNNDKYFKQYVIDSTNGPTVVGERFGFSDGLFSGFNADKKSYDKKTWAFEMDANGVPVRDETLTHPRCVLQLLKKHYDRYTLDKVSETTGTPKEDLLRVYETFASTGAPDKAGTIMYAMGWAGPRKAWVCRTSAPCPSSSSCSATSAWRAAASTRCAANPTCRVPPTRRSLRTSGPATCPCPLPR